MPEEEGWWERLSASAKQAVRWAHAFALLRSQGGPSGDPAATDEIDAFDLLSGLLIVHGDDSEPWDFFEHFEIPVGSVLRRDRAEASQLDEALKRSEREYPVPPLFGEASAIVDYGLGRLAPSDPEGLLSFSLLFAALLETSNNASSAIRDALDAQGAPSGDIISSYHDYATASRVAAS